MKKGHSILFIYEGYTEKEFYDAVFQLKLKGKNISIDKHNLKGITKGMTKKVIDRISAYLDDKLKDKYAHIHVFVAYDREGVRSTDTLLDIDKVRKEFDKNPRIGSVNEIVATQCLESWFFHDMPGLYSYLKVPKKERTILKHPNTEAVHHKDLSRMFAKYGKTYTKRGNAAAGFINSLNLELIYNECEDLRVGIDTMIKLFSKKARKQ